MDVRSEVGRGEGLDGPGQISEGNPPVDHQTFDLVEGRDVPGVGRVPPVAPARAFPNNRFWFYQDDKSKTGSDEFLSH